MFMFRCCTKELRKKSSANIQCVCNSEASFCPAVMCHICYQVWLLLSSAGSQWHPWSLKVCMHIVAMCKFFRLHLNGYPNLRAKFYLFVCNGLGTWIVVQWNSGSYFCRALPHSKQGFFCEDSCPTSCMVPKDVRVLCVCKMKVFKRCIGKL